MKTEIEKIQEIRQKASELVKLIAKLKPANVTQYTNRDYLNTAAERALELSESYLRELEEP